MITKKAEAEEIFDTLAVNDTKELDLPGKAVPAFRSYLNRYCIEFDKQIRSRYDRDKKRLIIWRVK